MRVWGGALGLGTLATVACAGAGLRELHIAVAAMVAAVLALLAVRENRALLASGAGKSTLAAATARHMGMVWLWGAASLFFIYAFLVSWREWWQFFLAFGVVAALCLFFAAMLGRDAAAGREDESMLKLARTLTLVQLAGMVITVVGLILDGKMARYATPRFTDWAGNNIFFFGALALAAISVNALLASRSPKRA